MTRTSRARMRSLTRRSLLIGIHLSVVYILPLDRGLDASTASDRANRRSDAHNGIYHVSTRPVNGRTSASAAISETRQPIHQTPGRLILTQRGSGVEFRGATRCMRGPSARSSRMISTGVVTIVG